MVKPKGRGAKAELRPEGDQATFVVVRYQVENNGSSMAPAFARVAKRFVLQDDTTGDAFARPPGCKASSILAENTGANNVGSELAPGATDAGVIAYIVPGKARALRWVALAGGQYVTLPVE